jgi:hypothetical protein
MKWTSFAVAVIGAWIFLSATGGSVMLDVICGAAIAVLGVMGAIKKA